MAHALTVASTLLTVSSSVIQIFICKTLKTLGSTSPPVTHREVQLNVHHGGSGLAIAPAAAPLSLRQGTQREAVHTALAGATAAVRPGQVCVGLHTILEDTHACRDCLQHQSLHLAQEHGRRAGHDATRRLQEAKGKSSNER